MDLQLDEELNMAETIEIKIIARIQNDFPTKFGVPRQSGLAEHVLSKVVFEPEYRNPDALRGIEQYSHLWLIWQFSENKQHTNWPATVRPPRLGGNTRVGVFATRSPFRPNAMGLSSVKLEKVEQDSKLGSVLWISGADLVDGTPIFDIKPYLPYVDSHPEAAGGFAEEKKEYRLSVEMSEELQQLLPEEKRAALLEVLSQDPRPSYHKDPERVYGFPYAGFDVRFRVAEDVLYVCDMVKVKPI